MIQIYLLLTAAFLAVCPTTVSDTPARVNSAQYVLEGTVMTLLTSNNTTVAVIDVKQYLKGNGPRIVTLTNLSSGSDCKSSVKTGDHLIFYTVGSPNIELRAFYVSENNDALDAVSPELISKITSLANQKPIVPAASLDIASLATPTNWLLYGLLAGGIVLVIVGGVGFFIWRKRGR